MKGFIRRDVSLTNLVVIFARSFLVASFSFWLTRASAQTAPGLAISTAGTNQFSITITNGISTANYEVLWTPVLGNTTDYPWTMISPGTTGQTNFLVKNWGYPAVFFWGVLDTSSPPLWENATPNNPGTNLLQVTILSPGNGAILQ